MKSSNPESTDEKEPTDVDTSKKTEESKEEKSKIDEIRHVIS